jgi:Ca-activated chloride channel family protein
MSFGAPHWLWGLWLLLILALLFFNSERRIALRLRDFVSPRLLPQLTASVDRFRRTVRFGLQLLTLAAAFAALAHPRWGYTFEEAKRKGIDLLIAVDTSRSMLSNDVQPNRLERVKLAAQDLITELQGDRVGLIAFAGRAFLQAPLTIDYSAAVDAINDLDTKTIPEGGTNISEAINLASRTYNKSAVGNRALVIFTDGEELSGDAVKAAKAAADAGIKVFTVGVGTSQGSLIPISGDDGGSGFVKDNSGQVVKSKLDETRLREIAEATGGFYLHLENGPPTMQHLFAEGLGKMTAKEMDVRLSRRPIERYEWPLGGAALALTLSLLMSDRKRARIRATTPAAVKLAPTAAAILFLSFTPAFGTSSGLNLYQDKNYADAYQAFQEDIKNHPDSPDKDKMQFDAGAAAYQLRNYDKAAEAFSQALLTNDKQLQEGSHYNMGRTLEERADLAKNDDVALRDLENAQSHYEDALKLNPDNAGAKANLDAVKKKIENLKNKRKQKPPPTPPPQQQQKQDKNQQDQGGGGGGGGSSKDNQQNQNQQNQNQGQGQNQANNQGGGGKDQQQQNQNQQNQNKKDQKNQDQSQAKNDRQPNEQGNGGESPSPSPPGKSSESPSPSPGKGEKKEDNQGAGAEDKPPEPSPTPGDEQGNESTSPTPGQGEGSDEGGASPSATPAASPQKKFAGDIKGASQNHSPSPDQSGQIAEAEADKEGEMSQRQARALLDSSKNDEARVLLDERRVARRVYKDW